MRPVGKKGVLCLDVEGGWGGSSRSLYYLVEALNRNAFEPVVFIRKDGPVRAMYENIGVRCDYVPELASFRPAERKNIVSFAVFLWGLRKFPRVLRKVRDAVRQNGIRLIHVNHESLAVTGWLLARATGLPWIAHNRTTLAPSFSARLVHWLMIKEAARLIYIVEPVREHVRASLGTRFDDSKSAIVRNIVPDMDDEHELLPELQMPPGKFRVVSLTNFSPNRGVDRIIDIAEELHRRGDARFAFYLCGLPANTSALTGKIAPYYAQIQQRVEKLGLTDAVFFPGHVSEPERALASCDALIKLTRQDNAWGRDIMEALTAGLPVITQGTYHGLVEPGENGYIESDYKPSDIADYLQELADDPALCRKISNANRIKASRLFDADHCAREMERHYDAVIGATI